MTPPHRACDHPECTGWHSTSHKPYSDICPSLRSTTTKTVVCANGGCGESFIAKGRQISARMKYCSERCRLATPATCEYCGAGFSGANYRKKFCSRDCRSLAHGEVPGGALKYARRGHKGRAILNGTIDQYDGTIEGRKPELGERDGWTCRECGVAVHLNNWDSKNPPRDYLTIGHKVAMVLGGTHTWDNVQAECWLCNVTKGNAEKKQAREKGFQYDYGKVAESPEVQRDCLHCGASFTVAADSRQRLCGTDECCGPERQCAQCGETFHSQVERKYCGRGCARLGRAENMPRSPRCQLRLKDGRSCKFSEGHVNRCQSDEKIVRCCRPSEVHPLWGATRTAEHPAGRPCILPEGHGGKHKYKRPPSYTAARKK